MRRSAPPIQVLCKGVPLGEGRAINCLAANQPALSPNCKEAIATSAVDSQVSCAPAI